MKFLYISLTTPGDPIPPHWGGVSVSNYDNAYNSDDDSNLFQGRSPHQQTQPQGAQ